ncbi:unnamed protein product [Symbiodinium microadriaticum]|nr:unnamed protein product [Symbiodinium microadriaticum]
MTFPKERQAELLDFDIDQAAAYAHVRLVRRKTSKKHLASEVSFLKKRRNAVQEVKFNREKHRKKVSLQEHETREKKARVTYDRAIAKRGSDRMRFEDMVVYLADGVLRANVMVVEDATAACLTVRFRAVFAGQSRNLPSSLPGVAKVSFLLTSVQRPSRDLGGIPGLSVTDRDKFLEALLERYLKGQVSPDEDAEKAHTGAAWNADLVLAYTNGVQKIMDYWPGIYEAVLKDFGDQYRCAQNLFRADLVFNPVPLRTQAIENIIEYHYATPSVQAFCDLYDKHYRAANDNEKVLRDPKLADLLMRADEHPKGSPFDHYTKLQWLISKSKTEHGISWVFQAVWDGYKNGWLKADYLSKRALQGESFPGGTVNILLGMMELKTILLHETSKPFAWEPEIRKKMDEVFASHESYRRFCGHKNQKIDLTFKAGWPKSALQFFDHIENCCFNDSYLAAYKQLLKNRKSVPDWVDHSDLDKPLQEIHQLFEDEKKEKTNGEARRTAAASENDDEEAKLLKAAAETEDDKEHGHLKVSIQVVKVEYEWGGGKDQRPLGFDFLRPDDDDRRPPPPPPPMHTATTYPDDDDGESETDWSPSPSSMPTSSDEATTAPRPSRVSTTPPRNESPRIPFAALPGATSSKDKTKKKKDKKDKKAKKIKLPATTKKKDTEDEEAKLLSGLDDEEDVKASDMLKTLKSTAVSEWKGEERLQRSQVFAFLPFVKDPDETWLVSYAEKKKMYGNQIIRVGGKNEPDDSSGGRRQDKDLEPFCYHSLPVEELLYDYNVGYLLDLSVSDDDAEENDEEEENDNDDEGGDSDEDEGAGGDDDDEEEQTDDDPDEEDDEEEKPKRGALDERAGLMGVADRIAEMQPDAFMLENVVSIASKKNLMNGDHLYNIKIKVLDALHFDLPQARRRLWIVGYKKKLAGNRRQLLLPQRDIDQAETQVIRYFAEVGSWGL